MTTDRRSIGNLFLESYNYMLNRNERAQEHTRRNFSQLLQIIIGLLRAVATLRHEEAKCLLLRPLPKIVSQNNF